MSLDDLNRQISAPLGEWAGDLDYVPSRGQHLSSSGLCIVGTNQDESLVCKMYIDANAHVYGNNFSARAVREIRMMLLAGSDSAVRLHGRLFQGGEIMGFFTPYEKPLDYASVSSETKRRMISEMEALVRRVHESGLIHGDIKPDNVLIRRSDGKLVLCDWAGAQFEKDAVMPLEGTTGYQSAWRFKNYERPLCREDDLYALGVSIWQIWVNKDPFNPNEHEDLEDDIMNGLRPDLNQVDDEEVRRLIKTYLDISPPHRDAKPGDL
ncbi:kinase-like protein [Favolaschia claudopus]|uniref:Kinase-like protein n=1 Tax=Favolaschia claudopus TaxID=2862362 RepID=A0AAW0AZU4_9AGAR